MRAFRNAQPDSKTSCAGDYLTGQKGEVTNWIYWTGGFDITFKKIDGFGQPLAEAVFTLYTDAECKVPFRKSGANLTAVSSDGTLTNRAGETVEEGVVLFEQIPSGIYYIKETTVPDGYENSSIYIALVGEGAFRNIGTGVLKDITKEVLEARLGTGEDKKDAAIFLMDKDTDSGNSDIAVVIPDISKYGILNISSEQRKAILKKTDSENTPLTGAKFDILRYDRSVVDSGTVSGESGAFWIGKLPFGTYYLHETKVPDGYASLETRDNWFRVTVNDKGVVVSERLNEEP